MKMYTVTLEEMTKNANLAILALAKTLLDADVISDKQFTTITEDFAVLCADKNFFGRHLAKVMGWEDKESIYYKAIQINNIKYNKKENNDDHQTENGDRERLDNRPN